MTDTSKNVYEYRMEEGHSCSALTCYRSSGSVKKTNSESSLNYLANSKIGEFTTRYVCYVSYYISTGLNKFSKIIQLSKRFLSCWYITHVHPIHNSMHIIIYEADITHKYKL
jgi:hypothetical protein